MSSVIPQEFVRNYLRKTRGDVRPTSKAADQSAWTRTPGCDARPKDTQRQSSILWQSQNKSHNGSNESMTKYIERLLRKISTPQFNVISKDFDLRGSNDLDKFLKHIDDILTP